MAKALGRLTLLFCIHSVYQGAFADTNPCGGPDALLNLINRPSVADSACIVPRAQGVFEGGYQYINSTYGSTLQDYPNAVLRIGLPLQTELVVVTPNYYHQLKPGASGWGPTGMGLKHQLMITESWVHSIETIITFASGGNTFGTNQMNAVINFLFDYNITSSMTFSGMFGIGTQSLPANLGGARYTTFNPDVLLGVQLRDRLNMYIEFYGQTATAPGQGAGFNSDIGLLYLVTHHFEIDASYGHRISGQLGGLRDYYALGCGLLF